MAWMVNLAGFPRTTLLNSCGWAVIVGGSATCMKKKQKLYVQHWLLWSYLMQGKLSFSTSALPPSLPHKKTWWILCSAYMDFELVFWTWRFIIWWNLKNLHHITGCYFWPPIFMPYWADKRYNHHTKGGSWPKAWVCWHQVNLAFTCHCMYAVVQEPLMLKIHYSLFAWV